VALLESQSKRNSKVSVHSLCYLFSEQSDVIKTKDIQDALWASKYAYLEGEISVGDLVPGTNFRVTVLKEAKLFDDGTGFRVYVAEEGMTTIVAYRGTDS